MVLSFVATNIQLGLGSPRSCRDDCFEIVGQVEHLRSRHESGLFRRQIGCEVLMKLSGVEISETVCSLLYRSRLAEVTWESQGDCHAGTE